MKLDNRYAGLFLPIILIIPFAIISLYNHPALDDWWYAEAYKQHGLIGAQSYWYNHYTARFVSNFIMTVAPLSFGWIEGYKVLPIVFLIGLLATFCYIVFVLFPFLKRVQKASLSLWFTATYLLIQRDYFECLYWLSANVVYQFTMIFFMLHITLMYKTVNLQENKLGYLFLAIILSVMVTGSNETLGGLILLEAVMLLIFYYQKLKAFSIIFFSAQLLCWLIMFFAPGNWSKIHDATKEHVYTFFFIKAISYSILSAGYYTLFLLKQPSIWCLIILSIPVVKSVVCEKLGVSNKNLLLLFAAGNVIIAVAIYFISIYPTGILVPPLRVTNIAIVFLFLTISVLTTWLTESILFANSVFDFLNNRKPLVMTACILFAVITPTKYHELLSDITSGKAKEYNRSMYRRYTKLKSINADTCYLEKLHSLPRTIVATDVSGDVSENIGMIFGKSIKVIVR